MIKCINQLKQILPSLFGVSTQETKDTHAVQSCVHFILLKSVSELHLKGAATLNQILHPSDPPHSPRSGFDPTMSRCLIILTVCFNLRFSPELEIDLPRSFEARQSKTGSLRLFMSMSACVYVCALTNQARSMQPNMLIIVMHMMSLGRVSSSGRWLSA